MILYSSDMFEFLVSFILIVIVSLIVYHRPKVAAFERKLLWYAKTYTNALLWTLAAYFAERKKEMFVIIKSPGYVPERKHNVNNSFKAIYKEIDSENPNSIEIMPNVFMCYDTDGAAKNAAPCMTDERVNNIYYGDVIFYAVNIEGNAPRCLSEREAAFVMNYIANFRADKHLIAKN